MTAHETDLDERGATLIIVVGFLVIMGLLSAGVVNLLLTSSSTRGPLDSLRNAQYDADGAIEQAIQETRGTIASNPAAPCSAPSKTYSGPNGQTVQVDCAYKQRFTLSGYLQRNVLFVACEPQSGSAPCGTAAIITAQVNYVSQNPPTDTTIVVRDVLVQSWSVNR